MSTFHLMLCILTTILPQIIFAANSFTNPLRVKDGSDPFMVYSDGYYYLTTTTWKDIQLTRAKTIDGLKMGETKVVWKDGDKNRCCNVWAPGTCYLRWRGEVLDIAGSLLQR
jgi:GH43 family beta-xylosidase